MNDAAPDGLPETVCGLLVNAKGEVLLGLRAKWKRVAAGQWDAPGGLCEPGETLEEALIRELTEEIGVRATRYSLIASIREPRPDVYPDAMHHVYSVTGWQGEPANICDEHDEIRWFCAAEIAKLTNLTAFDWPALIALADASQ